MRKYLEKEYGSQRIYQGGLRVYTTLDPEMQRLAVSALRRGLRTLDRRARGFVKPEATLLKDGLLPDPVHLDEWDWPFAAGDVVRGVVLASDRSIAVVQIGEYKARLGPAEIAWTRRTNVAEVLPRGTVAPFLIQSLSKEGERREARVALEQEPKVEGSILAMDVKTGAVRAMVGGYDFERSKFNRATQALRQVGSAFKPIVYSAAIEKMRWTAGHHHRGLPHLLPEPVEQDGLVAPELRPPLSGPIPLRRAIEQSRNVPAVKTLQAEGIETGIDYARKLGLAGELPPYLPIALGAGEATLVEMVGAFATFANQGLRMKPMLVTRITDRDGNVIEENRPQAKDAIRADTAYIMTSLLRGVVERGTAVRAKALKRPIAGKTGTTNDFTDAWFIGFEPSLCAGVWVGFDEKKDSLGKDETGGHAALPIWLDFWKPITEEKPIEEYPSPPTSSSCPSTRWAAPATPACPACRWRPSWRAPEPRFSSGLGAGPS